MDVMEADGILVRPEDVGIVPTHVHPSFMVPKMDDGNFTGEYRLVTGLSSLSPFLKPVRVPLPTIEEAFRKLGKWQFVIMADLKSWHWQIPISKDSMRFFGTATPYGGLRLYAVQPMERYGILRVSQIVKEQMEVGWRGSIYCWHKGLAKTLKPIFCINWT